MKLPVIPLLLLSIHSLSQDAKLPLNSEGKASYSEVVQIDSNSASVLFGKARLFITKAFKSGKAVTDLTDVENKNVITKGWTPIVLKWLGIPYNYQLWFTMTVQCKDNRYKYTFDDFNLEYKSTQMQSPVHYDIASNDKPKGFGKKQWESVVEQVDTNMKLLISDLKKQMSDKANSDF